jgi:hypothetical protein
MVASLIEPVSLLAITGKCVKHRQARILSGTFCRFKDCEQGGTVALGARAAEAAWANGTIYPAAIASRTRQCSL